MKFKPTGGGNLRLPGDQTPSNQALLMQNVDMTHDEIFDQIKGSCKYHGTTLGTNAPTAIMVNYNEQENRQDVLTAVDDKILRKNFGSNEFETLISGLTTSHAKIKNYVNLVSKSYIANAADGLLEFDGVGVIKKVNNILLRDIIYSKETNRCFAITANNELAWTDDLVDTAGVPIKWPGVNIATFPSTHGDVMEKLWIFNGRLIIFMTNSIWVQYIIGSPSNWRPEKVNFSGGCVASQTVKLVNGELWFLGYSPETGRGVYSLDSSLSVKLLSYDYEPILNRINYFKIGEAVAECVDNLYKISFALDTAQENDTTLHFDMININKESGVPNIYGPHTYGFSASAVLNTRQFKGEHLIGRKHTDGARVFRVGNYRTQYSDELSDNGSLINPVILSGVYTRAGKDGEYDETWFKRFTKFFVEYPPSGSWPVQLDILKGYENEVFKNYVQYLEGNNTPLEALSLGSDAIDFVSLSDTTHPSNIVSDAIQFKISNFQVAQRLAFKSISFDAKPHRRKKSVQIIFN